MPLSSCEICFLSDFAAFFVKSGAREKQGIISIFEKCKGKQVKVPLDLDLYQGKINYSLSYGCSPITI